MITLNELIPQNLHTHILSNDVPNCNDGLNHAYPFWNKTTQKDLNNHLIFGHLGFASRGTEMFRITRYDIELAYARNFDLTPYAHAICKRINLTNAELQDEANQVTYSEKVTPLLYRLLLSMDLKYMDQLEVADIKWDLVPPFARRKNVFYPEQMCSDSFFEQFGLKLTHPFAGAPFIYKGELNDS